MLLVQKASFDVRETSAEPLGHEGVEDGVEDRVEVVKDTWRIGVNSTV